MCRQRARLAREYHFLCLDSFPQQTDAFEIRANFTRFRLREAWLAKGRKCAKHNKIQLLTFFDTLINNYN